MKYGVILLLAVVAFSCNRNVERSVSFYYDTDSLMQEQKQRLSQKEAQIIKRAVVDGDTSDAIVTPDSLVAWDHEFQMFEKIDINKPALKGVYQVKEYNDTRSNLKIREYYSTTKDVEVSFLRLYYLGTPENLRIIEAKYIEENPIFSAQRKFKFVFDDFTGTPVLQQYTITGSQKMIFKNPVHFKIEAEIKF